MSIDKREENEKKKKERKKEWKKEKEKNVFQCCSGGAMSNDTLYHGEGIF